MTLKDIKEAICYYPMFVAIDTPFARTVNDRIMVFTSFHNVQHNLYMRFLLYFNFRRSVIGDAIREPYE